MKINSCIKINYQKLLIFVLIILFLSGIFIAFLKVLVPYSYWVDELISVNVSSQSLSALYQFLLSDTHPPLYQVFLKLWMKAFGSGEIATRFLSWLFAAGAVYPLLRFSKRFGLNFLLVSLSFYSTNKLFYFLCK